jgi:hypothetical protein
MKRRHDLNASAGTGSTRYTNGAMQNELELGSRSSDERAVYACGGARGAISERTSERGGRTCSKNLEPAERALGIDSCSEEQWASSRSVLSKEDASCDSSATAWGPPSDDGTENAMGSNRASRRKSRPPRRLRKALFRLKGSPPPKGIRDPDL